MKISLQEKIDQLKNLCSEFKKNDFLTLLAAFMMQIAQRDKHPILKYLMSPMHALYYIAIFNIQGNNTKRRRIDFTTTEKETWDKIVFLINSIESDYYNMLSFPEDGKVTDEKFKRTYVSFSTYLGFFYNGPLYYIEQQIERIEEIFKRQEDVIFKNFGLNLNDFICFIEELQSQINLNLHKKIGCKQARVDYFEQLKYGRPTSEILKENSALQPLVDFQLNPGIIYILDIQNIETKLISKEKLIKVINLLTFDSSKCKTKVNYYTDKNPLLRFPFIQLSESKYLCFYMNQCIEAIFNMLFEFCKNKNIQITKYRDSYLENKALSLFKKYLSTAHFYTSYTIDGHCEQDLLVIYKDTIFIIEAKAKQYREPLRDPKIAFERIKDDFKNSIQYAYNQIRRVENSLYTKDIVNIKDKKGKKLLHTINTNKIRHIYTIIVTYDRLGVIQTDLSNMLTLEDDNLRYPWCVNIFDLEPFLLLLLKRNKGINELKDFLEYRELFHGHMHCADELELCGLFIENKRQFINLSKSEEKIYFDPRTSDIFDKEYNTGLGFEKERMIKEKKQGAKNLYS